MKAQMAAATKHVFTIKILDKLPGLFKPNRYLYYCARCKWSFVVNDGRSGVISPVDNDGNPLPHDEARSRVATFALGPWTAEYLRWFMWGWRQSLNSRRSARPGVMVRVPSATAMGGKARM